jgi:hypothetical protein
MAPWQIRLLVVQNLDVHSGALIALQSFAAIPETGLRDDRARGLPCETWQGWKMPALEIDSFVVQTLAYRRLLLSSWVPFANR